jgi:hypothetical protein
VVAVEREQRQMGRLPPRPCACALQGTDAEAGAAGVQGGPLPGSLSGGGLIARQVCRLPSVCEAGEAPGIAVQTGGECAVVE